MLHRKKATEAAKAAAAAAAGADAVSIDGSAVSGSDAGTSPATPSTVDAGAGAASKPKISLLGGREGRAVAGGAAALGTKPMKASDLRIQKDVSSLDIRDAGEVSWPNPDDLSHMKLIVRPDSGLWKHGTFEFTIDVGSEYPIKPPTVLCQTKLFHPNITYEGKVCLNILREDWRPVYDLSIVINGLLFLFYEPNATDPLNRVAADMMHRTPDKFAEAVTTSLRGGTVDGQTFPRNYR